MPGWTTAVGRERALLYPYTLSELASAAAWTFGSSEVTIE